MALDVIGRPGPFHDGNCHSVWKGFPTRTPSPKDFRYGIQSAHPCAQFGSTKIWLSSTGAARSSVYNHARRAPSIPTLRTEHLPSRSQVRKSCCNRANKGHEPYYPKGIGFCFSRSSGLDSDFRGWFGRDDINTYNTFSTDHISRNFLQGDTGTSYPHSTFFGTPCHEHSWPWKSSETHSKERLGNLTVLGSSSGECVGLQRREKEIDVKSSIPWLPRRTNTSRSHSLTSARPKRGANHRESPRRPVVRQCVPQAHDSPPKRDTGIASEKDWGINLKNELTTESGVDSDGGSWYRESGEDLGDNGYRCRWTVMGGKNGEGSSEWREVWWEKSDWTGYKELGAEKSGKNPQGDSWWETWQEVLRQDDWSNLARIERSAQKQAKSGSGTAGWYEKWWEKYNAKGWSEKGAHKYGRLNDQGWWEKWGEQYDGRGAVLKWTDKWAETDMGTKWGDKWEEKFNQGVGTRQGETWHYSANGERWSRTWGEEHVGNGKVHKYGKSTSGESWDSVVEEGTFYQAEPHYGWADAVGNSIQLLAIKTLERPPGIYPDLDLGMPSQ